MSYIDFDVLCTNQNGPIFLDEKVAKFLLNSKERFLSTDRINSSQKTFSKLASIFSTQISFSHNLVLSSTNEWNIIENTHKGKGAFGSVNESKYKIKISNDSKFQAQIIPVNDVIKIQKSASPSDYEMLLQLAIKEGKLQKKHGVTVKAVVGAGDKVITVLENCGTSLDKFLPFTPSASHSFKLRLEVAARIASEMLLLQQNGIIHRDLKPANICYKKIANDKFNIIFIDFGLAEDINSKDNYVPSGTPLYMAPEVLNGSRSTYQSDMYALAAILGEIFGATNIFKNKKKAAPYNGTPLFYNKLAAAPYCFDGIFTGYDVSDVDPNLLEDIKKLLNHLQSTNPEVRPKIDQVNKFLITLPARMDLYNTFNNKWYLMEQQFVQFETYHEQMNLLYKKHKLDRFKKNTFVDSKQYSNPFVDNLLETRGAIYQQISKLPFPKSHFNLSDQLIKENRTADFDGSDCPYPNLDSLIKLLQKENSKFAEAINSFNRWVGGFMRGSQLADKFINSNSSGLFKIAKILNSNQSPVEKLYLLQQLGKSKTEKGIFYFFSHSKIFGKGRHEHVEQLYKKLAHINPTIETDAYFAKNQLEEMNQFIQETNTFTHEYNSSCY